MKKIRHYIVAVIIIFILCAFVFIENSNNAETVQNIDNQIEKTNTLLVEEKVEKQSQESDINYQPKVGYERENVLYIDGFENYEISESETLDETFKKWNSFLFWSNSDNYVSGTTEKLAFRYLEAKGVDGNNPDETYYYNGKTFVRNYFNEETNEISYVLGFPYEDNEDLIGVTFDLNNTESKSYIDYKLNENGYTTNEEIFDIKSGKTLDYAYKYVEGLPFTFIDTKKDNLLDRETFKYQQWDELLHIYQKDDFDETGRLTKYTKFENVFDVEYNENSQITEIYGEFEDIYGGMSEQYEKYNYKGDLLDKCEYYYNGTSGGSGVLAYDDQGRVIYNSTYITHGRVYKYYIYEGDSRRPKSIITYDSFGASGGEIEDTRYTIGSCNVGIDLFNKVEIK